MIDTIVLVDDEADILEIQLEALKTLDADTHKFTDSLAAWEFIRKNSVSLVVTDWIMPKMSGMDLLFKVRGLDRPPYVVLLSAHGTVERAVQAMNQGAFSFLEKPYQLDRYLGVVNDALARYHAKPVSAPGELRKTRTFRGRAEPVFKSPAMAQVCKMARNAAETDSSVLLLGESGTGKEVLADFIHYNSRRAGGPIVKVNCGALPEHLMESELFGHEKGAFTGAARQNIGRFEQASGGTLFLDEVGDLLPNLQVKLLRALQDRVIERVGSGAPVPVDFRLICATHRDLKAAVAAKEFRDDLYYRINVVPIAMPALRDRREDIEPLALNFFNLLRADLSAAPERISPEALEALQRFSWPGNVRQLRNAIEYALVMSKGEVIGFEHLPEEVRQQAPAQGGGSAAAPAAAPLKPADPGLRNSVREAEAELIRAALVRHHWQISKVARELKVSRSTLYMHMKAFGINRPE